jgi:hypothetical protein
MKAGADLFGCAGMMNTDDSWRQRGLSSTVELNENVVARRFKKSDG